MIHRSIYEAARHGPAQVAEVAAGLITFMLGSTGVLLLIHGATLFERSTIRQSTAPHTRTRDNCISTLTEPIMSAGRAYDTRRGVAAIQAHQALTLAAESTRRVRSALLLLGTRRGSQPTAMY